MTYVFNLSIGPVQEFIASARRSRDLWFGSWLLSEVSKAAAKVVGREKLVFPCVESDEDLEPVEYKDGARVRGTDFNVVNKIVAIVEEEPRALAVRVKAAMDERLEWLRAEAYARLNLSLVKESIARKQVADLLEFYWAVCTVEGEDGYERAREESEALLAARKNLRDFGQVTRNPTDPRGWGSRARKSSLDGQRESVIDEDAYKLPAEELREQLGLREKERLCGVGLLKRHGNRQGDDSFFSTSHVAALPLLERLKGEEAKSAADEYILRLAELLGVVNELEAQQLREGDGGGRRPLELPKDKRRVLRKKIGFVPERAARAPHEAFGRWDGHVLFEERLREFFNDDRLKQAKTALREFLKKALDDENPKPYYALLLADGDRMGEAIDAVPSVEGHRALSKNLSEFVARARHRRR